MTLTSSWPLLVILLTFKKSIRPILFYKEKKKRKNTHEELQTKISNQINGNSKILTTKSWRCNVFSQSFLVLFFLNVKQPTNSENMPLWIITYDKSVLFAHPLTSTHLYRDKRNVRKTEYILNGSLRANMNFVQRR